MKNVYFMFLVFIILSQMVITSSGSDYFSFPDRTHIVIEDLKEDTMSINILRDDTDVVLSFQSRVNINISYIGPEDNLDKEIRFPNDCGMSSTIFNQSTSMNAIIAEPNTDVVCHPTIVSLQLRDLIGVVDEHMGFLLRFSNYSTSSYEGNYSFKMGYLCNKANITCGYADIMVQWPDKLYITTEKAEYVYELPSEDLNQSTVITNPSERTTENNQLPVESITGFITITAIIVLYQKYRKSDQNLN